MLNLPNLITLIRIALIPCFVAALLRYRETGDEAFRWWAVAAFFIAMASDALDGMIARMRNQKTLLGSYLDPLADKLLLLAAVVILSIRMGCLTKLPSWFPVLVISRDLLIALGSLLVHMLCGSLTPRPSAAGKCATMFQMLTVVWVLCGWPYVHALLYAAAVFTVISGIGYLLDGLRQLHESGTKAET
jgi:CDP-diacylglycerol--glycerol-3-phosphate 3-phosphatidyltransferase